MNVLAFVSQKGRVHLAVARNDSVLRSGQAICGHLLEANAVLSRVAAQDIPNLQNFTICPNCELFYLNGGYREFAMATCAEHPGTIPDESPRFHRVEGKNQLSLF